MISKFFIDRPVFACVLSLLIVLAGGVSMMVLPIDRYPQITPPQVQISASYPGADAETASQSVAAPIEQELSGARHMIYFSSQSSNSGDVTITATFEIGTDQDLAAVEIQNRLSIAEPRLPEEVVRQGLTVTKASSNILAVVTLRSDDPRYDDLFLSNYAVINLVDELRRVEGVGNTRVFGAKDYSMRIWVNPDKLAARSMTVSDVADAIREQNAVFPAGTIGQRPVGGDVELTVPVLTSGRLNKVKDYEQIILRAGADGSVVRLKDVARVELGAQGYGQIGRANGEPTALLLVYLQNGANALGTIERVRETLDASSRSFPEGVSYGIPYDTTEFITASVEEVEHTLFEAVLLVIAVVFVFLQSWRATLIPLLAVPVAIIGTFAGMMALGFTINTLTLFGLVLAIGIVVDDAIIVVENVERIMEEDRVGSYEATVKAMRQVTGPVIAIVLVLCAVFVPVAFLGGLTGQLYKQFAITIAMSVAISGLVALTLSPALCRLLLKPGHGEPFFLARWFNSFFERVTFGYTGVVSWGIRHTIVTLLIFGVMVFAAWRMFSIVPTGFLPDEDQGFLITIVQLPDGASLERTDAFLQEIEAFFLKQEEVKNATMLGGFDLLTNGTASTSSATFFVTLTPWEERQGEGQSANEIAGRATMHFAGAKEGVVFALSPAPIPGLSQQAGFELQLQSRGEADISRLAQVTDEFVAEASANAPVVNMRGALRYTVPQFFVHLDREKTKMLGVSLDEVFDSLQAYLGSLYVNDFDRFGRIWRVQLQAEPSFRDEPSDIDSIRVRNADHKMLPLSTLVTREDTVGPNVVTRFNGYPSIQVTGAPAPGQSSGQAMNALVDLAAEKLPKGYTFEWSGTSYQEVKAGSQTLMVLGFGLIVVYLVLAAQYEQWLLPVSVLMSVPFAALGALIAIQERGLIQDLYFQVGLLTLIGLAAKNAILIVEFCSELHRDGQPLVQAALQAARIRFRPIIMTSLAFILGVVPLAISNGAGAAARQSIGTGVIGGMLAATFLATLFVPLFFVLIQSLADWRSAEKHDAK